MKVVGIRLPEEIIERLKKIPDWSTVARQWIIKGLAEYKPATELDKSVVLSQLEPLSRKITRLKMNPKFRHAKDNVKTIKRAEEGNHSRCRVIRLSDNFYTEITRDRYAEVKAENEAVVKAFEEEIAKLEHRFAELQRKLSG